MDERTQLERAHKGDRAAFDDLYWQHAPGAWRLALVVGRDTALAAAAVVDASVRVLGGGRRHDLFAPVAVQVLTAARAAASHADHLPAVARHLEVHLPELSVLGTRVPREDEALAAFERLPEQWRTVLWLREVERLPVGQVAAVLGLTEQSCIQLAGRAQVGLHEHFAQAQVRAAASPDCQRTAIRLSGYVADTLSERDSARVRRHLDRCEDCQRRLDEVDDLAPRLHRTIPALPVTVGDLARRAWEDHTRRAGGPIGVRLPNGTLAPAWAERAMAGATAALVALGITAAIALGGRRADDQITRETASDQPVGAGDGESALGGDQPVDPSTDGGAGSTPVPQGPDRSTPSDPASPAPRSYDPSGPAGTPPAAAPPARPAAPATPTSPPTTTPPTSPPTTTPPTPVDGVLDAVGDVIAPLGLCTGVGPVDDLTCTAPGGAAPALPLLGG